MWSIFHSIGNRLFNNTCICWSTHLKIIISTNNIIRIPYSITHLRGHLSHYPTDPFLYQTSFTLNCHFCHSPLVAHPFFAESTLVIRSHVHLCLLCYSIFVITICIQMYCVLHIHCHRRADWTKRKMLRAHKKVENEKKRMIKWFVLNTIFFRTHTYTWPNNNNNSSKQKQNQKK